MCLCNVCSHLHSFIYLINVDDKIALQSALNTSMDKGRTQYNIN
jgi:hypothetical protein